MTQSAPAICTNRAWEISPVSSRQWHKRNRWNLYTKTETHCRIRVVSFNWSSESDWALDFYSGPVSRLSLCRWCKCARKSERVDCTDGMRCGIRVEVGQLEVRLCCVCATERKLILILHLDRFEYLIHAIMRRRSDCWGDWWTNNRRYATNASSTNASSSTPKSSTGAQWFVAIFDETIRAAGSSSKSLSIAESKCNEFGATSQPKSIGVELVKTCDQYGNSDTDFTNSSDFRWHFTIIGGKRATWTGCIDDKCDQHNKFVGWWTVEQHFAAKERNSTPSLWRYHRKEKVTEIGGWGSHYRHALGARIALFTNEVALQGNT